MWRFALLRFFLRRSVGVMSALSFVDILRRQRPRTPHVGLERLMPTYIRKVDVGFWALA
jgi:hypothetical protein